MVLTGKRLRHICEYVAKDVFDNDIDHPPCVDKVWYYSNTRGCSLYRTKFNRIARVMLARQLRQSYFMWRIDYGQDETVETDTNIIKFPLHKARIPGRFKK